LPPAPPAEPASFDDSTAEFFRVGDSLVPTESPPPLTPSEPVGVEIHVDPPAEDGELGLARRGRRQRLGRVVGAAVVLAGLLCVAAFVRGRPVAPLPAVHATAALASPPPVAEPPSTPEAVPPAPETSVEDEGPSAVALREEARGLLVKHQLTEAIAAAKRSVELDPEDATAWLILGAANLEAGHGADAILAFRTCVRSAKTGPVGECRAFIR
jgi:hypothetical protein